MGHFRISRQEREENFDFLFLKVGQKIWVILTKNIAGKMFLKNNTFYENFYFCEKLPQQICCYANAGLKLKPVFSQVKIKNKFICFFCSSFFRFNFRFYYFFHQKPYTCLALYKNLFFGYFESPSHKSQKGFENYIKLIFELKKCYKITVSFFYPNDDTFS